MFHLRELIIIVVLCYTYIFTWCCSVQLVFKLSTFAVSFLPCNPGPHPKFGVMLFCLKNSLLKFLW